MYRRLYEYTVNESRETSGHMNRIVDLTRILTENMAKKAVYQDAANSFDEIVRASAFHDIGHAKISDSLANGKKMKIESERQHFERHTIDGAMIVSDFAAKNNARLPYAEDIAMHHHERWDGKGYPRGLHGTAIPLCARILSVVLVYEMFVTKIAQNEIDPHRTACIHIETQSGIIFDPDIVECFKTAECEFEHAVMKNHSRVIA